MACRFRARVNPGGGCVNKECCNLDEAFLGDWLTARLLRTRQSTHRIELADAKAEALASLEVYGQFVRAYASFDVEQFLFLDDADRSGLQGGVL